MQATPLTASELFAYASVLLATLTLVVALAGIFAFLGLRRTAKKEAQRVAAEIAEARAETAANLYLQSELPELMRIYMTFGPESANIDRGDSVAKEGGS
ncbi:hypothetical protein [Bosea sp. (in: a-proteobacteria)]|uniref:hypothetical protein n=1 Tax=Bosea sp. (in: a-proteobacteria) TaxID=1871050 RepID=UPI002603A2D4|nr:hypothetical protein [Bosea sp. (in: a-proteobacteria)]MCO5092638.1 hypothetical protein [Bosea sp. (in: a-proteobacteria)]